MRPLHRRPVALLGLWLSLSGVGCEGAQQGAYAPCVEPAGTVLDCPLGPEDDPSFTAWDACTKLAACGVILLQDDPSDPQPDTPDPFAACVDQIQRAQADLGSTVLRCIQFTPCPDLQETVDDSDDPNAQNTNIEGIIGWCGRLDPR